MSTLGLHNPAVQILAAEEKASLPAPPWVYGVTVLGLLAVLLLITLSFNRDR